MNVEDAAAMDHLTKQEESKYESEDNSDEEPIGKQTATEETIAVAPMVLEEEIIVSNKSKPSGNQVQAPRVDEYARQYIGRPRVVVIETLITNNDKTQSIRHFSKTLISRLAKLKSNFL